MYLFVADKVTLIVLTVNLLHFSHLSWSFLLPRKLMVWLVVYMIHDSIPSAVRVHTVFQLPHEIIIFNAR